MAGLFEVTDEDVAVGTLVTPGWYPVECLSSVEDKDRNGLPLVKQTWKGLDGEAKHVKFFFQISAKGLGFAKGLITAVTGRFAKGDKLDFAERIYKGKKLDGYVKRGEYEGREKNELADFAPLGTHTKK